MVRLTQQEDECPSSRKKVKPARYDVRAGRTPSTVVRPSPRYGRKSVQLQSGRPSSQSQSGSRPQNDCLAPSYGQNIENKTP